MAVHFEGDSQQRYIRSIKKDFTVREFVLSVVDFNLCGRYALSQDVTPMSANIVLVIYQKTAFQVIILIK
jgi:hypothetical protein